MIRILFSKKKKTPVDVEQSSSMVNPIFAGQKVGFVYLACLAPLGHWESTSK